MFTEAMTTFTNTVIITSMLVLLDASNFTIGLLAALPTFANLFQLASIWLVSRFPERRTISVVCSILARIPLLLLGSYLYFNNDPALAIIVGLFFLYYLFGSIAGPAWNSWMKDFIPEQELGSFFSKRTMYMQIVSLILFLVITFLLEFFKGHNNAVPVYLYGILIFLAGIVGLLGTILLSKVPDVPTAEVKENFFNILLLPLKDKNFRGLLIFQSVWAFAFGMTNPFFSVYQLTTLEFSVTKVLLLSLVGQLTGIFLIKKWGSLSDKYSNKSILLVLVPVFMITLILWCFLDPRNNLIFNTSLVVLIQFLLGASQSGINQCLNNITLKLSPGALSVAYLSTKNILISCFASFAPIVGGILSDSFSVYRFEIMARYNNKSGEYLFHIFTLQEWTLLFLVGAIIVYIASQLLNIVQEKGETEKDVVVDFMRERIYTNIKTYFAMGTLLSKIKSITK
jgi:MFS family permease